MKIMTTNELNPYFFTANKYHSFKIKTNENLNVKIQLWKWQPKHYINTLIEILLFRYGHTFQPQFISSFFYFANEKYSFADVPKLLYLCHWENYHSLRWGLNIKFAHLLNMWTLMYCVNWEYMCQVWVWDSCGVG